jgi:outer membrane protein OmpA-like peptidoglycan-associated protein
MKSLLVLCTFSLFAAWAQVVEHPDPQPIYRVTVVSRTLEAVNYEHRGGPTMIDFQGTVLLAKAKGQAVVESKRGRVSIDAKLEHLEPPTRFGPEYLTYVLWAISPEGRPRNLGEVLVDSSNKAHITVTSEMQSFGMIVTAEPYYSVTIPSDVVVMENVVRPDTIGTRELVTAKYELLPRGQYTMNIQPAQLHSVAAAEAEKLPYDRYEALLELYQAENAVQIAQSLGADRYAPEPFGKAVAMLHDARALYDRKQDTHMIVSNAREATQMAEDARTISVKRREEERVNRERQQSQDEEGRLRREHRDAELAQAQAAAEQADAERAALEARAAIEQARAIAAENAVQSRPQPPPPLVATPVRPAEYELTAAQHQSRAELLAGLNALLATRDTPRGLVVIVPDAMFEPGQGTVPRPTASERLMRVASLVSARPGIMLRVEGYMDDHAGGEQADVLSQTRAETVRATLVRYGVNPGSASAVGFGKARPIASNATPSGREENRRVEIVIAGPSIGGMALWERTYSLKPQR